MDERQRRLLADLTRLFGEGAGAFYSDALTVLETPGLRATSHWTSHSIREIQGIVFKVLGILPDDIGAFDASGGVKQQTGEVGEGQRREDNIRAIAQLLVISEEDERIVWWLNYNPQKYAHRNDIDAPRALDPTIWPAFERLLALLCERFEAIYKQAQDKVAELIRLGPGVGSKQISRVLERLPVSAQPVALAYFCGHAGPEWVPLIPEKLLKNPPGAHPVAGYAHPSWPIAWFLGRSAKAQPDAVHRAVMKIMDVGTDNNRIHMELAQAEEKLPGKQTAEWGKKEAEWLRGQLSIQSAYLWTPIEHCVIALVKKGEPDAAFDLAQALFSIDGELAGGDGAPQPLTTASHYLTSLGPIATALSDAKPLEVTEWVCDIVVKHVASQIGSEHYDPAWLMVPSVAQEDRHFVGLGHLVYALRDLMAEIVTRRPDLAPEILAILHRKLGLYPIGRRLRLNLMTTHLSVFRADAVEALSDPGSFAPALSLEVMSLLVEASQALAPEERLPVLDAIAKGSIRDELRATLRQMVLDGGPTDEQRAEIQTANQLFVVGRVADDNSPVPYETLASWPVSQLIDYLATWSPADDREAFLSGSALVGLVTAAVANDPTKYAPAALSFLPLGPTYVSSFLSGLVQAVTNNRPFDWEVVLDLAATVLNDVVRSDARYEGVRHGLVQLLWLGLESKTATPDHRFSDRIWELLVVLLGDPSPSREQELESIKRGGSLDSISMNWIRPMAVQSVVAYALWLYRGADEQKRMPASVKAVLKQRLRPREEHSLAVRVVLATHFLQLVDLDSAWSKSIVRYLFPVSPRREKEWAAAFDSYLGHYRYPTKPGLELLHGEYERAARTPEQLGVAGWGPALVHHLVMMYVWGLIEIDPLDSILEAFYDHASVELKTQLLDWMGWQLWAWREQPVSQEIRDRARKCWEWRMANGSDEEQDAFGWWFASGLFDADWSLAQLLRVLETGVTFKGTVQSVFERALELRPEHPLEVVRAANAYVLSDASRSDWGLANDAIYEIAMSSREEPVASDEVRRLGAEVESRLLARGYDASRRRPRG
ncbi:MAG: hypothetical protein ABSG37_13235 [Candidatus Limnocylindrales bacterium]|jgi:hypothetical protein